MDWVGHFVKVDVASRKWRGGGWDFFLKRREFPGGQGVETRSSG